MTDEALPDSIPAERAKKLLDKVNEISRLEKALDDARTALVKAQGALEYMQGEATEEFQLGPRDSIDLTTGAIARVAG